MSQHVLVGSSKCHWTNQAVDDWVKKENLDISVVLCDSQKSPHCSNPEVMGYPTLLACEGSTCSVVTSGYVPGSTLTAIPKK